MEFSQGESQRLLIVSYSAFSVAVGFLTVRNLAAADNAAVAAGFLIVRNFVATENAAVAAVFLTVRNPAAISEFESNHYLLHVRNILRERCISRGGNCVRFPRRRLYQFEKTYFSTQ